MKSLFAFLVFAFLIFAHGPAMAGSVDPALSSLTIHLTGFKHSSGTAKVCLVNSKANFSDETPYKNFTFQIINQEVVQTIQLPQGEYAIKVYHDENANNALDKRIMGLPKERYGFSNNARGLMGPPEYEEAMFLIDSPQKTVSITVK